MQRLNSCNQTTALVSSTDTERTKLHDISDVPRVQPNRFLAVVMLIAAVLTAGHFLSPDRSGLASAHALLQTVDSHG